MEYQPLISEEHKSYRELGKKEYIETKFGKICIYVHGEEKEQNELAIITYHDIYLNRINFL